MPSYIVESWEKGYEVLKEANDEAEKYRKKVKELMNGKDLTQENYEKIKQYLEKESEIRCKALEKAEKIHRDKTENLEQWGDN